MKKILACLIFAATTATTTILAADSKSFQASLTPGIAIYTRTTEIEGLSLSIWGENPQSGLSIGLVNGSTGESAGLTAGLFNYADSYKGVQWSVVNYTKNNFSGWQGGPFFWFLVSGVNYTGGEMTGLQSGLVNYAGNLTGLQVGAINVAAKSNAGLQIGIINVIQENQLWFGEFPNAVAPAMILVNWRF